MTDSHQLRLVVVGHVDDGKSTLIGRIFYDTGSLPTGKYEQLVGIAQRRGVPFEFANLMDGLQAERDQNITIDTAQIWFRTKQREYVIIDAPGHKEFVKNMVTGASRADAALIIIDALEGVQEQTRRHGYLLRLIGVRQVVVVVNKMDLVGYSQATFDKVSTEYRKFLAGIDVQARRILPVSAREGDNIAARGENLKWFDGPTVVQALDEIPDAAEITNQPLRFPIQDVYRFDHRRILAGRIEAGTLKVGDQLVFLPTGRTSVVRSIESWNTPQVDALRAGDPAGVTLADQLFVERGSMAVHADDAPSLATEFTARIFWLGRTPLSAGKRYKLKLVTQEVECEIKTLEEVVDASTVETIKGADAVRTNDAARVIIRTRRPVAVDLFERIPTLGRLVLVDGFDVAGGGIVIEIPERFAAANVVGDAGLSTDRRTSRAENVICATATAAPSYGSREFPVAERPRWPEPWSASCSSSTFRSSSSTARTSGPGSARISASPDPTARKTCAAWRRWRNSSRHQARSASWRSRRRRAPSGTARARFSIRMTAPGFPSSRRTSAAPTTSALNTSRRSMRK